MIESGQLKTKPEVIANRGFDSKVFTGSRMLKTYGGGMQHHAFHAKNIPEIFVLLDIAMPDIADNRVINMGKVLSDLMPAACFGPGFYQRESG
ncbi:MAG: hypothetical protein ACKOCH_07460, partial [Bacteroidota bacterium]